MKQWTIYFSDWQDLNAGIAYLPGKGPQAFPNSYGVHDVVSKSYHDYTILELEAEQAKRKEHSNYLNSECLYLKRVIEKLKDQRDCYIKAYVEQQWERDHTRSPDADIDGMIQTSEMELDTIIHRYEGNNG